MRVARSFLNVSILILGSWRAVLGGFKYAKDIGTVSATDVAYEYKVWDWLPIPGDYGFNNDIYSLTCLMYSFYHKTLILSRTKVSIVLMFDSTEDFYLRLHLKHFIKTVMFILGYQSDRYKRFTAADFMGHPFFKDEVWMSNFEDRFRSYNSQYQDMDIILEADKSLVFTGNFFDKIDRRVVGYIKKTFTKGNNPKDPDIDGQTFLGLWLAVRNRKHHRDTDPYVVQRVMGPLPVDNFRFWATTFPNFFLYLFVKVSGFKPSAHPSLARVCSDPEFKYFYTSPKDFYYACCECKVEEPSQAKLAW